MPVIWLNGSLYGPQEAHISVDDRGFRFGDGVFETIPVRDGVAYLWDYHMERLADGLRALHIAYDVRQLVPAARALINHQPQRHGLLRLQISRGAGSRGYMPSPDCKTPTALMQWLEPPPPSGKSVSLFVSNYEKISASALPTQYKLAQGLGSILARLEAVERGFADAVQCSARGYLAEATSANLFWRKSGRLFTPSLACGAVAGVTRRRLMEIVPYEVEEGEYSLGDLNGADALVLTNASMGVTAVGSLQNSHYFRKSENLRFELDQLRNDDILKYVSACK